MGDAPPFTLTAPLDGASPIILASPHSGRHIPAAAAANFAVPLPALRRIEDACVDALIAPAAHAIGAPLIAATHARAVIDLNRAEDEYDPALIAGTMATPPQLTDRTRRGYGLVPRIAGTAAPLHHAPLPAAELHQRIATLHRPWHQAIATGLQRAVQQHGQALLLDCHSMPRLDLPHRADLVIGDRFGTAASAELVEWLASLFRAQGFTVARNSPYAGGHNIQHHGRPAQGVHAVQLEFCRSLYLHPATLEAGIGFETLQHRIRTVLIAAAADFAGLRAEAAE